MKKLFMVASLPALRASRLVALTVLLASTAATGALAQSAKDLVGAWTLVSADAYGPNPKGALIFDANGHFLHSLRGPTFPNMIQTAGRRALPRNTRLRFRDTSATLALMR
jgi:hypothetical protein